MIKLVVAALASVAQLVGVSSSKLEGWGFDSQSGHMPGFWVWSLVGALTGGNQSMFLSLPFMFLSLSLSPSLLFS